MTKRAENIIGKTYGLRITNQPALAALVEFAAQNSGLNWADYGGDGKAYRAEARAINQDWQRFKTALAVASAEEVTDTEVIAEAPHAFSGRLTWWNRCTYCNHCRKIVNPNAHSTTCPQCVRTDGVIHHEPHWEYCTGQYFPTEYRKAAATLLESATRRVRQARPKAKANITTISELKALHAKNGGCWFEPSTMRFFGTRIESGIIQGCYFVTSEQQDDNSRRRFTLRSFDDTGDIDTIGDFHGHATKEDAIASIPAFKTIAA